MIGHRVVPIASMGWSLGVIALVLKSGLIAPSISPPINIQDPLVLSVAVLKHAESFKGAAVGVAGSPPTRCWPGVWSSAVQIETRAFAIFWLPAQLPGGCTPWPVCGSKTRTSLRKVQQFFGIKAVRSPP